MNRNKNLSKIIVSAFVVISSGVMAQPSDSGGSSAPVLALPRAARTSSEKAARAANRKLVRAVSQALARAKGLDSTRLLVRAKGGDVTLLGSVPDTRQIQIAIDVAQQVDGVRSVQNEIHVVGPWN
ncbi:BON domain-containing protein [Burkholderia anthina]|uniref:BON domain-containing protein n=1 Tax=Burkholderia anthina TaxID=179879 RepID=UPI00158F65F5|nr:BON domain-containing protein [Burkholderia anthina]